MTLTALVVTTVHHPDDTRIRERLIRTLTGRFNVVYATRSPGPSDDTELVSKMLGGPRLLRDWRALLLMLWTRWDVAVVHDPELIPAAVIVRLLRNRPVVFDAHEDLRKQIVAKRWIPRPLKPLARSVASVLYSLAGRFLEITLAEPSYQDLFNGKCPVFPNFPRVAEWPMTSSVDSSPAIYVGDIRPERGVTDAIAACALLSVPLTLVGPLDERTRHELKSRSEELGCELQFLGRLPNTQALEVIADSSVGLSPLRALPNYLDSLPTKILEYLSVGIPVAASDLPGTREIVGDVEHVVFYEPGNDEGLARAIALARAPEMRSLAAEQAPSIRKRFTWPADDVLDYYEQLVSRGESPNPN